MADQPFQPPNPQQPIRVAHGQHLDQPPYAPPPPPSPAAPAPGTAYVPYPAQVVVQPVVVPQPADPAGGQAVTSLVLGIIGLVFAALGFVGCTIPIGLVLGTIGIVLGALGRRSLRHDGLATTGLVLSVITVAMSVGWGVWWALLLSTPTTPPL